MWILIATILALTTCAIVNIIKEYIYNNSIKKLNWKYSIGEKLIYHQSNCRYNRMIGCEVIERCYSKKFSKRNVPYYKVKAYAETSVVWVLTEDDFECTAEQFKEFPVYTKLKNIE